MVKSLPKLFLLVFFFGGLLFTESFGQTTGNQPNTKKIIESDTPEIDRIQEVNIKQNRLKEKLKESPLTVESMSAQSIKETPASYFYEALGHLKGC